MVNVPFLSFDRKSAIIGPALLLTGLAWLVFSAIYIVTGIGWEGSSRGGIACIILGGILMAASLAVVVFGIILTLINHKHLKRVDAGEEEAGDPISTYFDLSRLEAYLAMLMLPLSSAFLVNGVVYYVISKIMWEPGNMDLKRISQDFKSGATWMFVIMCALWIAAGICLFINRYLVMEQEGMPSSRKAGTKSKAKPPKNKEETKKPKKPLPPPPPDD
jgi:hypothetical protein